MQDRREYNSHDGYPENGGGESRQAPQIDPPVSVSPMFYTGAPGATAYRSTATKWKTLPARTNTCQMAWL